MSKSWKSETPGTRHSGIPAWVHIHRDPCGDSHHSQDNAEKDTRRAQGKRPKASIGNLHRNKKVVWGGVSRTEQLLRIETHLAQIHLLTLAIVHTLAPCHTTCRQIIKLYCGVGCRWSRQHCAGLGQATSYRQLGVVCVNRYSEAKSFVYSQEVRERLLSLCWFLQQRGQRHCLGNVKTAVTFWLLVLTERSRQPDDWKHTDLSCLTL